MDPVSLFDMEAMARLRMTHDLWDHIAGGDGDEITLRRNRTAFDEIVINPRFLVDPGQRDMSTTVLGTRIELPIMAAPLGVQWEVHPDGAVPVAKATGEVGTIMGLATGSNNTIREVAESIPGPWWQQLYHVDDEVTELLVTRAEAAGFSAVCLTIDGVGGRVREKDLRNNFQVQPGKGSAELRDRPDLLDKVRSRRDRPRLIWSRLAWLKSLSSLPLVVKGVLTVHDARQAVEHGANAIVVSNHGGRTTDTAAASIEVLPAIAEAVGGDVEVYMDSGIRRGTDVLKALALGARAVLVGRPVMWGLAIDGENGVRTMLEILRAEFEKAMAFCGVANLSEIDSSLVTLPGQPGNRHGVLSPPLQKGGIGGI